jgi:hypothetical protein
MRRYIPAVLRYVDATLDHGYFSYFHKLLAPMTSSSTSASVLIQAQDEEVEVEDERGDEGADQGGGQPNRAGKKTKRTCAYER